MYDYRKLTLFSLACVAASALTVPNSATPKLLSSSLTSIDEGLEAADIIESRSQGSSGTETLGRSNKYSRFHTYGSSYEFTARDGWESVPVTDLSYKYGNVSNTRSPDDIERRTRAKRGVKIDIDTEIVGGTVSHAVGDTWNSIKGLGKAQGVTITW